MLQHDVVHLWEKQVRSLFLGQFDTVHSFHVFCYLFVFHLVNTMPIVKWCEMVKWSIQLCGGGVILVFSYDYIHFPSDWTNK